MTVAAAVAGDCAKTLVLSRGSKPIRVDIGVAASSTAIPMNPMRAPAPALNPAGHLDGLLSEVFLGR